MNNLDSKAGIDSVRALQFCPEGLLVLDQRKLPASVVFNLCETVDEVAGAIADMQVRGAPAIGIAAAFGVVIAGRSRWARDPSNWREDIRQDIEKLAHSRPTAVNLFWALRRMESVIAAAEGDPTDRLRAAAQAIHDEDVVANQRMGRLGADLVKGSSGILTHCNTGSLATGGYGTALGVVRCASQQTQLKVFATETRPWLQGARLTVWELAQDRIPATLIADSAAAYLMRAGSVQWVIVGADRIAANGDTANKIGTYALAVAARHHGVKFMVVAPTSTIDLETASGSAIEIEQRAEAELLPRDLNDNDGMIRAWNPVFDVTPAELIDAIVTERGVVHAPKPGALQSMLEL